MAPDAQAINLLHYLPRSLQGRSDQLVASQAALRSTKEIVRRSHVQAHQHRSHNADHALPALVLTADSVQRALAALAHNQDFTERTFRKRNGNMIVPPAPDPR